METKHLTYFKVENFKRFDSLDVKDIGQFNLIVGDNNVGKTSLLEALLFDERDYATLYNLAYSLYVKGIFQINVANYNFLDFFVNEKSKPLRFKFKYNDLTLETVSVSKRLFSEMNSEDLKKLQNFFLINASPPASPPSGSGLDFAIEFDDGNEKKYEFTSFIPLNFHIKKAPYISFNILYDKDIVSFFSQLSIKSETLDNIRAELKYFIPDLISIEINNAIVPQQTVIAIRETGKDLIPLSQYGDGTLKLFRYLLELDNSENKRLMIDEIDTGIHYSRLKEYLKKVLQSAKNKNVQIFATTHSKECIEYYTQALKELGLENEGKIIKIADTKSGIKSYTSNYAQFENSLLAESEIR